MTYETILVSTEARVATITLDRPKKKNAMNPQMQIDMTNALEALRYDRDTAVVVITGSGDSFCAGMDLKEFFLAFQDRPDEYDRFDRMSIDWRSRTLRHYPKPTIAMVNGYCFGGGLSIVEGCDLAVAAEEATFGISEINFKMFPGGPVSRSIANLLRSRDALWYALTGRNFNGRIAAEIGLINTAVPLAQLQGDVTALALEIAAKDPLALKATKDAYRFSLEMSWEASMNYATAKYAELVLHQKDQWRQEDVTSFLDSGEASTLRRANKRTA